MKEFINSLAGLNRRLDTVGERINEHEDRSMEIIQIEGEGKKKNLLLEYLRPVRKY